MPWSVCLHVFDVHVCLNVSRLLCLLATLPLSMACPSKLRKWIATYRQEEQRPASRARQPRHVQHPAVPAAQPSHLPAVSQPASTAPLVHSLPRTLDSASLEHALLTEASLTAIASTATAPHTMESCKSHCVVNVDMRACVALVCAVKISLKHYGVDPHQVLSRMSFLSVSVHRVRIRKLCLYII